VEREADLSVLRLAATVDEGIEALAADPHGTLETGDQAEARNRDIERAAGVEVTLQERGDGRGQTGACGEGQGELQCEPWIDRN
jgi:hypothetical protein